MKRIISIFATLAVAALAISCAGSAASAGQEEELRPISAGENTRVNTTYGTIEGYLDGTIYTFKGIRYAKAERFMPPQDPDMYEGVRMCKIYGPQAPQNESLNWNEAASQTDYTFGNTFFLEPMDEACQVLNVWTPGLDSKKRPVFVWIHGGGFSSGSGHDLPCYEGYSLAKKGDIVYVNLNHRLNTLGFLDLSGLGGKYENSVNLGLQDIVKALEWIHKNIARFGGDPDMVTIAGQSGGGGKVSALLAMPSAKGLFHRAIIQSGSSFHFAESEQSRALGLATVKELGLTPATMDKIADIPYEQLVAAQRSASRKLSQGGSVMRSGRGFFMEGPVVDGKTLSAQYETVAPAECKDVPVLIGSNFNEFSFDVKKGLSEDEIMAQLTKRRGEDKARRLVEAFKKDYPTHDLSDVLYIDDLFRPGVVKQAAAKHEQGGAPAWVYLFNWRPTENVLGASHGMELPFMANNVSLMREMTGGSDRAYRFQEVVSNIWLAFIKTGNPNIAGLPAWEEYSAESAPTMILDDKCELVHHVDDDLIKVITE
ncbi:MAG: carboxylesterase/lipase family protein [Bacteroidales bacterium]|nr:carboxylesterase/lipase family protein [Bacteroidales bacterium]